MNLNLSAREQNYEKTIKSISEGNKILAKRLREEIEKNKELKIEIYKLNKEIRSYKRMEMMSKNERRFIKNN